MDYLNPLNWFKKSEPSAAPAVPSPAPVAPMTQAAGRRRHRATKKGGKRHAKKGGTMHAGRRHRK